MPSQLMRTERRSEKRLGLSLPMTLNGNKVKTNNISPGGVYFEVMINGTEEYCLGKTIKVEITASTHTLGLSGKIVKLTGVGVIVRIYKINTHRYGKNLGVALKFSEKLDLSV